MDHRQQLVTLELTIEDLCCPICMETIHDPFVTACGHSFCYHCISMHLQHKQSCPSCASYLAQDLIFPNFLLDKVRGGGGAVRPGQGWR